VLIDDSVVRGATSIKITQMMRDAGAREVHFPISSPPITERDQLLAARMDLEGMRRFVGADSLAFLSVDGTYRAMGYPGRNMKQPQFTDRELTEQAAAYSGAGRIARRWRTSSRFRTC
jgi:amidophosphoribosyltransferase